MSTSDRHRTLILMVSAITNEPRVRREARALADTGWDVRITGVRVDGDEPRRGTVDGHRVRRLDLPDMVAVRGLKAVLARRSRGDAGHAPEATAPAAPAGATPGRRGWISDVRDLVHLAAGACSFFLACWRDRPDVYHPHDIPPLLPSFVVARLRRKPLVYESHEYWMAKLPDAPLTHATMIAIERFVCRRADAVIAVNDSIADLMVTDYGIERPAVVINVPMRTDGVEPPSPRPADRPLQLLYHGIYVPGRGLEQLLEALTLVTSPVHLTLRGHGEQEGELRDLAARFGVADRVTFAPSVPMSELVGLATAADVGILPFEDRFGYHLALPNKLFEYMGAGLAIVANDLPEIARIVATERCGATYDGSVAGLAATIDVLAADRATLDGYRSRSYAAVVERYNWVAQQHTLLDAYEQALTRRSRRS